jgi:wyosine [tRNA(Phe)-imidazoG37] synthetase (radical SAM superfamily)
LPPWEIDIITLSGSGEPTLAANLGEIITQIKQLTHCPVLVLTNATLLNDPIVRQELSLADKVSVKLDGVSTEKMRGVDRPVAGIELSDILSGIQQLKQNYAGELGIQTMLLSPWRSEDRQQYIKWVKEINPAEIQLNTPTRPKPLKHELDGRGNHDPESDRAYPVQNFKMRESRYFTTICQ